MLSLRLSAEQERRLTSLASRRGVTRSQWLREAIERQLAAEDAAIDPHAVYLELTAALGPLPGSGRRDGARLHGKLLKDKLRAGRRR